MSSTVFCMLWLFSCIHGQSLTVTPFPEVLFNGRNQNILEGSVAWLNCEVNSVSSALTLTWNKNGQVLVQDVPHILLRSSETDMNTMFLLVVEPVGIADSGTYQCIAQEGENRVFGTTLRLTVIATQVDGTLQLVTANSFFSSLLVFRGHMIANIGSRYIISWGITHVGDDSTAYLEPSVLWLKDGKPFRLAPTIISGPNGRLTTTISFLFTEPDNGVYQVYFSDATRSEFILTPPILFHSGNEITFERISPPVVILSPPEKLVLEVKADGMYILIDWTKNGRGGLRMNDESFVLSENNTAHFNKVYTNSPTTSAYDIGLYKATLLIGSGESDLELFIAVIQLVHTTTNAINSTATVVTRRSVNISCISYGIPVPTITWRFNNQPAIYTQTDIFTNYSVSFTGDIIDEITQGNVVSTLHVVDARTTGEYVCIGSNTHSGATTTSSAMITVQVLDISLNVVSFPDVLFSGGSQSLLEGSVVWLYCQVNIQSSSLKLAWNKDSEQLVQNMPHIRLRSSDSTLILVIDGFRFSDSGLYQCLAWDHVETALGTELALSANPVGVDGTMAIRTADPSTNLPFPSTNRVGYEIVAQVSHYYVVGHFGDDSIAYQTPSVLWLKDGVPFRVTPTNIPGTNGRLNTTISFTFAESDAGVYQVVFTDTTRSEVFLTDPIRLETGEVITIKAVSPPITILRLPETLVLEFRSTGRYKTIQWQRNGTMVTDQNSYAHFFEVYFSEATTVADFGVYQVTAVVLPGTSQVAPMALNFFVIQFVGVNTSVNIESPVRLTEGESVDISCTSTGIPVPTITWTLNNRLTPYTQTDLSTDYSVISNPSIEVTLGRVMSTLHIVNGAYGGEYVCLGSNAHTEISVISPATIFVQFLALPVVNVIADDVRVSLFEDVTLTCSATGGNSNVYEYTWTHVTTSTVLTGETSSTLSLPRISVNKLGTYRCEVRNEVGIGMNTITIRLGIAPVVATRVSPPGPIIEGSTVNLVCEASAGDLPISYSWTSPNGTSLSSDSSVGIILISFLQDYGEYTCTANNLYGVVTSTLTVVLGASSNKIALGLFLNSDCNSWVNANPDEKINDVIGAMTEYINARCQCNIYFTDSHFHCFSTLLSYVTLFSTIDGTSQVPTSQLILYLESWVASAPTLTIQSKSLSIDMNCTFSVSSFFEECREAIVVKPGPGGTSSSTISAVIAAMMVAVAIIVLISMLAVITRLLTQQRRRRMQKKTPPKFTESGLSDAFLKMHNQYEESLRSVHLKKYNDPISISSSNESIPSEDSDIEEPPRSNQDTRLSIQRDIHSLVGEKRNSDQELQLGRDVYRKSSRSSSQDERYIHGHPTPGVKSILKKKKSESSNFKHIQRVFQRKKASSRRVTFSKSAEFAILKQLSDSNRNRKPRRIKKLPVEKPLMPAPPRPPVPDNHEDEFEDAN